MTQAFSLLAGHYAITRLLPAAVLPDWALAATGFVSVTRTAEEISVVCLAQFVPTGTPSDAGWCCLKLHGPFAFDQVGILASFAVPLAQAGVGIFTISTFDTDYILIKEYHRTTAIEALLAAGHTMAGKY